MYRYLMHSEVIKLSDRDVKLVQQEFSELMEAGTEFTSQANACNREGTTSKNFLKVILWGENDPVNSPAQVEYVGCSLARGAFQSCPISPKIYAVCQEWIWQDAFDNCWYRSQRLAPSTIFGPRCYWKEVAITWRSSGSEERDGIEVGGYVKTLP
ncbi:MAG: hypothetical protein AB9866_23455 [Syntrophobacteraceae bacterium]